MSDDACRIEFDAGTLVVSGPQSATDPLTHHLLFDARIGKFRSEAASYGEIVRILCAEHLPFQDCARDYEELPLQLDSSFQPMAHQSDAMRDWRAAKGRGIVVMPTGSGKTFFAMMAMAAVRRSTLVVVPTIDLLHQWASRLESSFGISVGMLGGGSRDVQPVTVSTYDSAVIQMPFIGNKFGLIVLDECHHLPGAVNRTAAAMCLAPYRLGLTATPERQDDGDTILKKLVGDIVYYAHIDELEGDVLAPYRTKRIPVILSGAEQQEYDACRAQYLAFLRSTGIRFEERGAWTRFIAMCARRPGGRAALDAYLRQRMIARCSQAKLDVVWTLVRENSARGRILIFTADNAAAYRIGELLCLPVLTHKTKVAERKTFLDKFRSGAFPVLVTSKVLNEGVDVPEANIGIVVSGSGSTREHVQRLGRILRRTRDGKQATLYEIVSVGTSEMSVSERRRNHRAYRTGQKGGGRRC